MFKKVLKKPPVCLYYLIERRHRNVLFDCKASCLGDITIDDEAHWGRASCRNDLQKVDSSTSTM
jgi:hypothetical protein